MLFLRSWLEDYINVKEMDNQTLADFITDRCSEVDDIVEIKDYFGEKVLIGKIENVTGHPNADKLKIFDVNLGENKEKVKIVSGADNVREGLVVPVATIGAKLPAFTIMERKLRGETSYGMCLGKSEILQETEFSKGLWEIEKDLEGMDEKDYLGQSICKVLPSLFPIETIFDIKVLPDKIGQIGSYLGLALDIAIALEDKSRLTPLAQKLLNPQEVDKSQTELLEKLEKSKINLEFKEEANYATIFNLYEVELEKEYTLPHQIQKKMFLTDNNLTGTVADLSNYIMLEVGQPSHFFANK